MGSYRSEFVNNMFENIIISEMFKAYDTGLYDKCFMDVSLSDDLLSLYLDTLQASLVTLIRKPENLSKYGLITSDIEQLDVLSLDLEDRVGAFKEQYNIIVAFNSLALYNNDRTWQTCVENLLYYLKPGGLCFVNGTFLDNKCVINEKKFRSKGLWKAIVKHCNCSISDIIENPLVSFYKDDKIMVIRK